MFPGEPLKVTHLMVVFLSSSENVIIIYDDLKGVIFHHGH